MPKIRIYSIKRLDSQRKNIEVLQMSMVGLNPLESGLMNALASTVHLGRKQRHTSHSVERTATTITTYG